MIHSLEFTCAVGTGTGKEGTIRRLACKACLVSAKSFKVQQRMLATALFSFVFYINVS